MAIRTRPIIMRLAVTEYEKELIERKMAQLGTKNFGAYARKMLIDGYIIKVDYEKRQRLLHNGGVLAFITSNKLMRAGYGEKLRGFFAKETNPLVLIDLAGQKVVESATVDVNILIFTKAENSHHTMVCNAKDACLSHYHTCMTKECRVWTIKEGYRLGDDIQSKVLAFAFGLSAEIWRSQGRGISKAADRYLCKCGIRV